MNSTFTFRKGDAVIEAVDDMLIPSMHDLGSEGIDDFALYFRKGKFFIMQNL